MLDPDIAALLPQMHAKRTAWAEFPLAGLRKGLKRGMQLLDMSPRPLPEVRDLQLPGAEGVLTARLYRPHTERPLPLLLYVHGGGWVTLDVDSFDPFCRLLAAEADCLVLSLEYRLAPEHKFPAALQDVLAALRWARQQAIALGGDGRVGIGGDSAGGNLATVAALLTRQQAELAPDLQLLIYPAVDLYEQRPSYHAFAEGHVLERQAMEFFIAHYLNHEDEKHDLRVSPLRHDHLGGQPRALIYTAGFDPLRDEGAEYAERLAAAGVPVQYRCFAHLVHGFLQMGRLPAPLQAMTSVAHDLRACWAAQPTSGG